MVRTPFLDKNGVKKGSWSQEEDDKLRDYVMRYGHWNWRELPKFAGLSRCGKSCRLRWVNYLKPGVKRGDYSKEEEDLIIELHDKFGNRWSSIAAKLPGRTDNEVKNHWNSNLKNKLKDQYNSRSTDHQVTVVREREAESVRANISFIVPILESSAVLAEEDQSSSNSSPECGDSIYITASSSSSDVEETILLQDLQASGDFWTQPFIAEDDINNFNDHGHQDQGYSLFCQDYWELDFLSDISTHLSNLNNGIFYEAGKAESRV